MDGREVGVLQRQRSDGAALEHPEEVRPDRLQVVLGQVQVLQTRSPGTWVRGRAIDTHLKRGSLINFELRFGLECLGLKLGSRKIKQKPRDVFKSSVELFSRLGPSSKPSIRSKICSKIHQKPMKNI